MHGVRHAVLALQIDPCREMHQRTGELLHLERVQRRGADDHLQTVAGGTDTRQLAVDVLDELFVALGQQAVALVQHKEAAVVEREELAGNEVLQTPGRGHDDVHLQMRRASSIGPRASHRLTPRRSSSC